MAIRVYKPTSAGRRNASVNLHEEVTRKTPHKALLRPLPKKGGRNNTGKIMVRGRGGGAKRRYRMIDFRRNDRDGIVGKVLGIEYDPNRTCHIALIEYADGVFRYILAPKGIKDGDEVNIHKTSATQADTDGDGLSDGDEVNTKKTDPLDSDTDNDGLSDGAEVNTHKTDPLDFDSDDDTLSDGNEVQVHKTDPNDADSDDDGVNDNVEITNGTDPNDANSM